VSVAAGCGAGRAHPHATAPDGLRPTVGYASYDACSSGLSSCTGAVPDGLRRPLHTPRLAPGAPCPVTRTRAMMSFLGPVVGPGPVYPVLTVDASGSMMFDPPRAGQSIFPGSEWGGQKVLWAAAPRYAGSVLIRGRELDGPRAVGFDDDRVPFDEMQLLAAGATSSAEPTGWREWPSYTRLRVGGCYAYQVDGVSFSTVIVFRAASSH
jgi:hypothetical protein